MQGNTRLESEEAPRKREVGSATSRIVIGERVKLNSAVRVCCRNHLVGEFDHRELRVVADIHRPVVAAVEQAELTIDLIVDVAEAAGLGAVAVDSDRGVVEGLIDEVGNYATIVGAHVGSVSVERSDYANVEPVSPVIGQGQCLSEPFGLVVHTSWPVRVHVAPVRFGLRMYFGIAVDLTGRVQMESGALFLGKAEAVVGTQAPNLENLDRDPLEIERRSGAGEVHDDINLARNPDVIRDVLFDELKSVATEQLLDVLHLAGLEVVETDDLVAPIEQPFTQM